jgi:putative MATE family efflux protein
VKDLTQDSITLHILKMAGPAAITFFVAIAHQVVSLHFVSAIGTDAVAAVSAAGNAGFVVGALTQILNVGTVALVAHSAGRKDLSDIGVLFNQSLGLAVVCALGTVAVLCVLAHLYMTTLSPDPAVIDLGVRFLWWVSPAFALLFPMTVLGSTLRGLGLVSKPMLIFTLTIVIDAAFAVVLIPGRGFIPALGVEGAGLATTLSYVIGVILMLAYFRRTEPGIVIQRKLWAPQLDIWRRIFALGLPAAAELTLMFVSMSLVYLVIRNQGASAQAGFGMGFRVLQLLLLPGLAISLAAAPIAGQNYGARNFSRVREVFRTTAVLSSIVMLVVTLLVEWQPEVLLRFFETDAASAETATLFLHLMSWTLVAQGLVFTCTFMFQAMGNTVPALLSATARFIVFAVPAIWLSYQPGFRTEHVWYLFTASIVVQAVVSLWLLHIEFKRKLQPVAVEANNQTSTSRSISSYAPDAPGHIDPTKSV